MRARRLFLLMVLWFAGGMAEVRPAEGPPEPLREFRGAWVATVGNIDWPSKPGLSSNDQKAELRTILERAVELKLNALVLQVRPSCDAFYVSSLEPWSYFLTGGMGRPPDPLYDPLEFAVTEAHRRGLELHAWFNPFRALVSGGGAVVESHVTRRHPEWVRKYAGQLWLDPGEPAAREYSLAVILDVVRRYDIDAIHLDDYFYPYPTPAKTPFPDDATYRRYREGGGKLERDDWRRDNNNQLIAQLYARVKAEKRWVKVGLSPFGIWRPHVPPSIEAQLDAYAQLYADSKHWLEEGWCDYFAPQLYWPISPAKQSFPVLLNWWAEQNTQNRHLWPGLATERIGPARPAEEIARQIRLTRAMGGSVGHLHWNDHALMLDKGGIVSLLRAELYQPFALVPASPWLGGTKPAQPVVEYGGGRMTWKLPEGTLPRWWLLQVRQGKDWAAQLLPGTRTAAKLPAAEVIALRAMDAAGQLGEAGIVSPH